MFEQAVVVQGDLLSWGEVAALKSETGWNLMVDLRPLDPEVHAQVDQACSKEKRCLARIEGRIVHIRGTGISELGLRADSIEIR